MRLNQFVDAYLLVGRFIDPKVSGAVDRTRTAVSEYQSLDIRQLDLKVSFAILFGMVALLLLLSAVWLGLNFANAIVLPLVSVIQAAEDVRLGDLSRVLRSDARTMKLPSSANRSMRCSTRSTRTGKSLSGQQTARQTARVYRGRSWWCVIRGDRY